MNIQATTTTNFKVMLLPSATGLPTPAGTIPAALQALLQNAHGGNNSSLNNISRQVWSMT